jgi:hypothetical protein
VPRTRENKAKNAAAVKEVTSFQGNVYEPEVKMVRYAGPGDSVPVTRMLSSPQIKELEVAGFELSCPTWGGACTLERRTAPAVEDPEGVGTS